MISKGYDEVRALIPLKVNQINFFDRKFGHPRVESNGGLPGELGSRDWCHWIKLTKHS